MTVCPLGLSHLLPGLLFSGGSDGKESAHKAGDPGSSPGSGRSPEVGNGNPLQYACLENACLFAKEQTLRD